MYPTVNGGCSNEIDSYPVDEPCGALAVLNTGYERGQGSAGARTTDARPFGCGRRCCCHSNIRSADGPVRRAGPDGYHCEQFDVLGVALATGMKHAAKAFVSHC